MLMNLNSMTCIKKLKRNNFISYKFENKQANEEEDTGEAHH